MLIVSEVGPFARKFRKNFQDFLINEITWKFALFIAKRSVGMGLP